MGFDLSFHPLNTALFVKHIEPYIVDGTPLPASLVGEVLRNALHQRRARAWGMAVFDLSQKRPELFAPDFERDDDGTLTTKGSGIRFDSDLWLWGRPFFITDDDPAAVSARVDEYLACPDTDAVDALAHRMLHQVSPTLSDLVPACPPMKELPPERLRSRLFGELEALREATVALGTNRQIHFPTGYDTTATRILSLELPTTVVSFAARLRPAWTQRGLFFPTALLASSRLSKHFFENPGHLFAGTAARLNRVRVGIPGTFIGRALSALWGIRFGLAPTITENGVLGGYLRAERVTEFRKYLRDNRRRVLFSYDDESRPGVRLALRKLDETLYDAERRGLAFIEATDIYP